VDLGGGRPVIPRAPDYFAATRDQLARAAEAGHRGYGWDATRARDQRAGHADSLPAWRP
jgi:hypothetical protein